MGGGKLRADNGSSTITQVAVRAGNWGADVWHGCDIGDGPYGGVLGVADLRHRHGLGHRVPPSSNRAKLALHNPFPNERRVGSKAPDLLTPVTMDTRTVGARAVDEYLTETVRTWIGLPRSAPVHPPALPAALATRLLGTEERENPHRDQWGCWEAPFSEAFRNGTLWVPAVDEWVAQCRRDLVGRIALEPLWPDGKPFVMCLTHDVDMMSRDLTPTQALRTMRVGLTPSPGARERRLARIERVGRAVLKPFLRGVHAAPSAAQTIDRSLALEREYGVTASYFFTVYPPVRRSRYDCVYRLSDKCTFQGRPGRVRDVVRALFAEGFDVGLHGSYGTATDSAALAAEKRVLEDVLGTPVTTTRQHFLHWDIRHTPRAQARAGLTADSTAGFNRNIGFRLGTSLPFFLFDADAQQGLDLLEVPLIVQEAALFGTNSLELDTVSALAVVKALIDRIAAVQGVVTLLFHPHSFVNEVYVSLYRWCIEYGLRQGAWFASVRDVDRWWRTRAKRLAET